MHLLALNHYFYISEYIDFWLDNIHSYSRDEMNTPKDHKENHFINPPVIIVGTRIDKLEEVCFILLMKAYIP